jgi:hypothetical protein
LFAVVNVEVFAGMFRVGIVLIFGTWRVVGSVALLFELNAISVFARESVTVIVAGADQVIFGVRRVVTLLHTFVCFIDAVGVSVAHLMLLQAPRTIAHEVTSLWTWTFRRFLFIGSIGAFVA